jgi:hypothetical protein
LVRQGCIPAQADRKREEDLLGWEMTRPRQKKQASSPDIKSELKARMVERIDKLFERLPESSSLAEIEQALLKESPQMTSELFQALVDRQDFSPSSRTRETSKAATQRTQKK